MAIRAGSRDEQQPAKRTPSFSGALAGLKVGKYVRRPRNAYSIFSAVRLCLGGLENAG
jgi:hypothetical protein